MPPPGGPSYGSGIFPDPPAGGAIPGRKQRGRKDRRRRRRERRQQAREFARRQRRRDRRAVRDYRKSRPDRRAIRQQIDADRRAAEAARARATAARRRVRAAARRRARLEAEKVKQNRLAEARAAEQEARAKAQERRKAYETLAARARVSQARLSEAKDDIARRRRRLGRSVGENARVRLRSQKAARKKPDALRLLKEIRSLRRQQERRGGGVIDPEKLRQSDEEIQAIVEDWVGRYTEFRDRERRLAKRAVKGDRGALDKLLQLQRSGRNERIFREHRQLFGGKPGRPGAFDRYMMHRNDVQVEYNRYWEDIVSRFVPSTDREAVPGTRGGSSVPTRVPKQVAGPALVRRATSFQGAIAPFRLALQGGRDNLAEHMKTIAERAGAEWDPGRLEDPRYADEVIGLTMDDWRAKYWAQNGGAPEPIVDLFGIRVQSRENDDRIRAMQAEEERAREVLYRFIQDRPAPGQIEQMLEAVITSPAFTGAMNLLAGAPSAVGSVLRGGAAVAGGELVGPQLHIEALTDPVTTDKIRAALRGDGKAGMFDVGESELVRGLRERDPDLSHPLHQKLVQREDGFDHEAFRAWVAETPEGQRFWEGFRRRDPAARGLIEMPQDARPDGALVPTALSGLGLPVYVDVSSEAKGRARKDLDSYVDELATAAPGKGPIEWFWESLDATVRYGSEPAAKDAGNLFNLVAQVLLDPLAAASSLSRLPRIAQFALARGREDGLLAGGRSLLEQLAEHRLGFTRPGRVGAGVAFQDGKAVRGALAPLGSDPVGDFLELRRVSKMVRRQISDFSDMDERQIQSLLVASLKRTDRDPTAEGFLADLSRQFDRKIDSTPQVEAAIDRLFRSELAREGVEIIENVDQAKYLKQLEDDIAESRARIARRQADEAGSAEDIVSREAARTAREGRASRVPSARRSVFESADDFVDRPGKFRSPQPRGRVRDGRVARRYGDGLDTAAGGARVYAAVDPRHAEDAIALADSIARRRGIGVAWADSEARLAALDGPGIELFGGTPSEMAAVADELEAAMRKNRLGTTSSSFDGLSAFGDGRVLYRLDDGVDDAFRRRSRVRSLRDRTARHIDRDLPELEGLSGEIARLRELASKGDTKAQGRLATALKRQRQLQGRREGFDRVLRELDQELKGEAVRGSRVTAAQDAVYARELAQDAGFITRQLNDIARRRGTGVDEAVLDAQQRFWRDAQRGVELLGEDLAGPVKVAQRVMREHGDDVTDLMKPEQVAPFVPEEAAARGVDFELGVRLETARYTRSRAVRAEVGDVDDEALDAYERVMRPLEGTDRTVRLAMGGVDEVSGPFWKVWPVVRRAIDYSADWERVPQLRGYVESQMDALRAGGLVTDDLGPDAIAALDRMYDGALSSFAGRLHSWTWDEYRAFDEKVTKAVNATRGFEVERYTAGGRLRSWFEDDPARAAIGELQDFDLALVAAKADALADEGVPVGLYDQARYSLQNSLMRHDRALEIGERARAAGGDFRAAYLAERDEFARNISSDRLRQYAMRQPHGTSAGEVWDDFQRSLVDDQLSPPAIRTLTPWQARLEARVASDLAGGVDAMTDAAWADAIRPLAPSMESASQSRAYLLENGHWKPKTGEDVKLGRRVWSVDDEREYFRSNWGEEPRWTDIEYLRGLKVFDSQFAYEKAMVDLGVWDNTVDVKLRLSGRDADSQRLEVIWGDEAEGIKVMRSLPEQRKWMRERWGDKIADDGLPWLKDPTSVEYRQYVRARVKAGLREVADVDLLPERELDDFARVLSERAPHELEKLRKAYGEGGVVLEEALLERTLALTDDLLANPRWRPLFSRHSLGRQAPIHGGLSAVGYIQRLAIVTDMAFPILNRLEVAPVIGPKRMLVNIALRDTVGAGDVPMFVHARFPNIESTGLGSGTTIWARQGGASWARFDEALERLAGKHATKGDLWDAVAGGFRSVTDAGLEISARGEQALKLEMFKRLYTDQFARRVAGGMDEEAADIVARAVAQENVQRFFPNLAEAPRFVKALNEVVPFLHYQFATTKLFAREFLSHPWLIHKMWVLGNVLEEVNLSEWEREHPGVPYPDPSQLRTLNVQVDGETFSIDLLSTSDVFRGFKAIEMLTDGETRQLKDIASRFIRVPHPIQAQMWSLITGEPSWYTGEPVTWGDITFLAKTAEWWQQSLEDGKVSQADMFRMLTRAMFFSEAEAVDPLRGLNVQYWSLPEAVREEFLEAHPELKGYWQNLRSDPAREHLAEMGLVPKNWFKQASAAEIADLELAKKGLRELQVEFDRRLESYLASGGSPLDDAYKALRKERYLSVLDYRGRHKILQDYAAFYDGPEKWLEELQQEYNDGLYDKFQAMSKLEPQREDYKKPLAFLKARQAYYQARADFLEAHPQLFETLGRERTQLEQAVADTYERIGDVFDEVAKRDIQIAKAEARGKDRLAEALRGVNELEFLEIERSTSVSVAAEQPELPSFRFRAGGTPQEVADYHVGMRDATIQVVIPGFTDQRFRNATPEQREQMLRDHWYGREIGKIFDTSKDGAEFVRRLERRPQLLEEYFAKHPEKRQQWVDRSYYHDRLDEVMAKVKRTGDWSHWWKLMDGDKRFRQYYLQTHPEKAGDFAGTMKQFRKLGDIVQKAERSGDWDHLWRALRKDKKLREWWLDQEPGRRGRWEEQARYLAEVAPVVSKAVRTGDWGEWRKLMRDKRSLREAYFKRNPEAKAAWLRDESYQAAMQRWVRLARGGKQAEASEYFASLPKWMRRRYLSNNGKSDDGRGPGGFTARSRQAQVQGNAYVHAMRRWTSLFDSKGGEAAMRYFYNMPSWIRERYFATHPGQREKFAANDAYSRAMRRWVSFFEKDDFDGANAYFDSLPKWMRDRYYANNPDKRPGARGSGGFSGRPPWADDDKFAPQLGKYLLMTAQEKAAYLKSHGAFRAYLRGRGNNEDARRSKILAGYKGLPDDPWLRRVYRERYPEVFSEEAQGARRQQKFAEFLRGHPGMADEVQEAIDILTETYLAQVRFYGAAPKPLELDRLNEEERKRRTRRQRRQGRPQWEIAGDVPVEVPGLRNVLTGVA